MKAKQYIILLVMMLSFFSVLFLSSCAGTRQEDSSFEDELFGEDELEGIDDMVLSDLDASSDEDEVLRLLGISEDNNDNSQSFSQTEYAESTNVATRPSGNLEEQVNYLEDEAQRKDIEMSNLKADIAERERRIQELQNQLAQNGGTLPSSGSATGSFKGQYEQALNNYRTRNYRTAIQQFDVLLSQNATNTLVDNCQYWKGECYYALSDYNQAILEFQKVFMYGESNKIDDAQLKLGLCYLRLGDKQRSRTEFEKLISNYPDSEFVSRAQTYMSRL